VSIDRVAARRRRFCTLSAISARARAQGREREREKGKPKREKHGQRKERVQETGRGERESKEQSEQTLLRATTGDSHEKSVIKFRLKRNMPKDLLSLGDRARTKQSGTRGICEKAERRGNKRRKHVRARSRCSQHRPSLLVAR